MWPDLRKPNLIAQILCFNTLGKFNNCVFKKKNLTSLLTLFLVKEEANSYNLGIILFTQARRAWFFFWLQRTK